MKKQLKFNKNVDFIMTNEDVLRAEAYSFFNSEILTLEEWDRKAYAIHLCFQDPKNFKRAIEHRLKDFFSNESKSIFLDELKNLLKDYLDEFRPDLDDEESEDTLIGYYKSSFYINQFIEAYPAFLHENSKKSENYNRNKIFISYAHNDNQILTSLKRHFKILERTFGVEFWDDTRIIPGQKWEEEIQKAMTSAKIAIFILSADFFASEFIVNKELPTLLENAETEGATILSIIAKPCDFSGTPLAKYQALNAPNNTILHMNELEQEELWVSVVSQIRRILIIS